MYRHTPQWKKVEMWSFVDTLAMSVGKNFFNYIRTYMYINIKFSL